MGRVAIALTLTAMLVASTTSVLDAQRGGGGGGMQGGGQGGGSGFQFGAVVNLPAPPIPQSQGLSINRPLGSEITGVKTNPPPGFGPTRSPFDARPGTYTRLHRPGFFPAYGYGGYGYDVPVYGPSPVPESTYDKMFRRNAPADTRGTLLLDVTPASALVFVDTAYVGSVSDVQARGVMLNAGRHLLALEASGYNRQSLEITITAGEPLRYRVDLTPIRQAQAVVVPAGPPQTMYAIPGCYGGNRPPVASALPKGCDIAKVRVIRPQTRIN